MSQSHKTQVKHIEKTVHKATPGVDGYLAEHMGNEENWECPGTAPVELFNYSPITVLDKDYKISRQR